MPLPFSLCLRLEVYIGVVDHVQHDLLCPYFYRDIDEWFYVGVVQCMFKTVLNKRNKQKGSIITPAVSPSNVKLYISVKTNGLNGDIVGINSISLSSAILSSLHS